MNCRFCRWLRKLFDQEKSAATRGKGEERQPSATTISLINGHEAVDLGLSVKWAMCNVGADKPSDYGDHFAWGEITTKAEFTDENCKALGESLGSICGNSICGNAQFDAATANWGGSWRLPTKTEIEELIKRCKWTWTLRGVHNGALVTGPNGNSIFLPAAGFYLSTWHRGADDTGGGYWSGTPEEGISSYGFEFFSGDIDRDWIHRANIHRYLSPRPFGRSVRPVTE